jgi:hypothetical protein
MTEPRTEKERLTSRVVARQLRHNVETAQALNSPFACVAQDVATFAADEIMRLQRWRQYAIDKVGMGSALVAEIDSYASRRRA